MPNQAKVSVEPLVTNLVERSRDHGNGYEWLYLHDLRALQRPARKIVPFTPFHLGPGAICKAIGGHHFSFMIFGGSQVLMDIEPLIRIIRGDAVLHGPTHTVFGALVIAVASTLAGRPISDAALRVSGISARPISWIVALISALIGTYSHIGLDAIMHPDANPLWPIADGNDILGIVSVEALHLICMASGLLGGVLVLVRALRRWRLNTTTSFTGAKESR